MTTGKETSVVSDCDEPDYSAIELPAKDRTEYSYVERRAELLQLIEEVGHPAELNQTELADQYGVTQQQISKDFDRLATHIRARFDDRDQRGFIVDRVVNRAIRGLLEEEEYRKAAKTAIEYDEWVTEFHDLEKLHEQVRKLEQQ
jgi:stage III sporulation protein SpoIIIAA